MCVAPKAVGFRHKICIGCLILLSVVFLDANQTGILRWGSAVARPIERQLLIVNDDRLDLLDFVTRQSNDQMQVFVVIGGLDIDQWTGLAHSAIHCGSICDGLFDK